VWYQHVMSHVDMNHVTEPRAMSHVAYCAIVHAYHVYENSGHATWWVMSHINKSCHIASRVTLRVMSHGESCQMVTWQSHIMRGVCVMSRVTWHEGVVIHDQVMYHIWVSCVICAGDMRELCYVSELLATCESRHMSELQYMSKSCATYEWVVLHQW